MNSYLRGTAKRAVKSGAMMGAVSDKERRMLKTVTPKKLVTTMPKSMFKRTPKMMMSAVKAKFKK